tara:strand:+ start:3677 stop:4207 length:531 start_codon:yes stop_codon:yes gene_type:complete
LNGINSIIFLAIEKESHMKKAFGLFNKLILLGFLILPRNSHCAELTVTNLNTAFLALQESLQNGIEVDGENFSTSLADELLSYIYETIDIQNIPDEIQNFQGIDQRKTPNLELAIEKFLTSVELIMQDPKAITALKSQIETAICTLNIKKISTLNAQKREFTKRILLALKKLRRIS